MPEISKTAVGTSTGMQTFVYTWRDVVLYALGVGAKAEELEYLYEKNLKAVPSFGVIPLAGTFGITPPRSLPAGIWDLLGVPLEDALHMTEELVLHKPIPPMGGKLIYQDVLTNVSDRGGRGVVLRTEISAYDEAGEKVFTNFSDLVFLKYTSPGAGAPPKSAVEIPDRDPDLRERDFVPANQHLLYRLSGDTNRIHVDPQAAAAAGLPGPIMQGLCTFGYACRLSVKNLVPKEPERVKRIGTQFRNPLMPGSAIELQLWKVGAKQAFFRVVDLTTGLPALDRGFFEWE